MSSSARDKMKSCSDRPRRTIPWFWGRIALAGLRALLFFCLACSLGSVKAEPSAPRVLSTVSLLLPLSGNYAAIGNDNRQGIELAQSELGEAFPLKLLYADTRADPATAVTEFRKAVATEKAVGVFAFRGPVGMAVNPLSMNSHIPVLGGVGNRDFAMSNPYAFQLWSRSDDEGGFLADQLIKQKITSVALLTAQDDWSHSVSVGFQDRYMSSGGKLSVTQDFPPSESDFRTVISKIKISRARAVFVNLALPQLATFFRQAKEQNLNLPIFSNFWAAKSEVLQAAGDAVNGVQFVEMDTAVPGFIEKVKSRYSTTPSGATLSAYVAIYFLAQAGRDVHGSVTPESFYAALLKQSEVRTPERSYPVRDRCVVFPLVLRTISAK